jgi:hypothetical protein
MKIRLVALIAVLAALPSAAQAAAACPGRVVTRTGPTGITLQLCHDGKYTTCVRDSQRLGRSADAAKRYCDGKRDKGFIK